MFNGDNWRTEGAEKWSRGGWCFCWRGNYLFCFRGHVVLLFPTLSPVYSSSGLLGLDLFRFYTLLCSSSSNGATVSGMSNHLTLKIRVWLVQVVCAWQDLCVPSSPQPPLPVSLSLSAGGRQPAPGSALPSSARANQPGAPSIAPFPVSACRLLALSEGQFSAVRPTLPLQTTIKSPLFWAGGEKWEETDAPYKKTRFPWSPSKQHTGSLAVPP